jgi:hypothetical protein
MGMANIYHHGPHAGNADKFLTTMLYKHKANNSLKYTIQTQGVPDTQLMPINTIVMLSFDRL